MSIASNVKEHRAKRGLTQEELALITDVAKSTISDIERGSKNPSVKVAKKLAKVLHCTTDELLKD